jgi:hypothetical protein
MYKNQSKIEKKPTWEIKLKKSVIFFLWTQFDLALISDITNKKIKLINKKTKIKKNIIYN